jgi:hypothetical protein
LAFLQPDDDAGDRQYDDGELQQADDDTVREPEDVGLMEGEQPAGHGVAGVLAGGQQEELQFTGVGVEEDPAHALRVLDVPRAAHRVGIDPVPQNSTSR